MKNNSNNEGFWYIFCIFGCKYNNKTRKTIFLLVKNTLKVINKHEYDINDKKDGAIILQTVGAL